MGFARKKTKGKIMFKSVLMSTTLLVSLATMAQSGEIEVDVASEVTFGVNDQLADGTYLIGVVKLSAEQTFDNGFGWALTYKLDGEEYGWGNTVDYSDKLLFELTTAAGTLAYGDMNKKGASELFYNDLSGMGVDVVRYKNGYPSLRWRGDIGDSFSYAISSRNLNNNDEDEYSFGAGYEAEQFEIGLTYDNGSDAQDEAWATTFVYNGTIGSTVTAYTLSYIDADGGSSFGLEAVAEFDMGLTVGATYALNDIDGFEDGYGLSLDYETGSFVAAANYVYDGAEVVYDVALTYSIADFAPAGTTLYAGYVYDESSAEDTGYYVGAGFGIAKNTVVGVAYSETTEGDDLVVQPGLNAMLTVAF